MNLLLLLGIIFLTIGIITFILLLKKEVSKQVKVAGLGVAFFGMFTGSLLVLVGVFLQLGEDSYQPVVSDASSFVGQPAPDFDFLLINGDEEELSRVSDFRGQTVLINFWATWCAPCVKEMPDLSELHTRYEDELTVLCISDETSEQIRRFLDDFDDLQQKTGVLTGNRVPEAYQIMHSIRPVSFVIDSEGNIREIIRGARSLEQFEESVVQVMQ